MSDTVTVVYVPDVTATPVGVPVPPSLAPLLSPEFAGEPTVPTAPAGTATEQAASTAFVMRALATLRAATGGKAVSIFWKELAAARVLPSANGTACNARASGNVEGQPGGYSRFVVLISSSADGVLTIVNEDAPALTTSFSVKAGTTVRLTAQAFGSAFHAVFNPSAPAVVTLIDGYSNE